MEREPAIPRNEPILSYAPNSPERAELKQTLTRLAAAAVDIPLAIGGREVTTGVTAPCIMPHRHRHPLGQYHQAGPSEVAAAIDAALAAHAQWSSMAFEDRAAIFLRAADLLATKYRSLLDAATMLGQSKTVHQAEIDAACETIDFFRFNVHFARRICAEQPISLPDVKNELEARPLEGFVLAVAPFNFTAIAANLCTAPAIMGNTVVLKPASTAVLSSHYLMELLHEAGLPPGVINFVPGPSSAFSQALLHPDLAGIHFTGSTSVFQSIWAQVGANLSRYRGYPRLVGETGGKNFILAHASADEAALATAIVRGGYEYQGQKCSAASRIYVPEAMWPSLRDRLVALIQEIRVGDIRDFRNFMGAVIDRKSFENIQGYLGLARQETTVLAGARMDDQEGFFVWPTLLQTRDPLSRLMREEIFGPVVTVFVYRETEWEETLRLVDETTPYGLTGAIFARDRQIVAKARQSLRYSAGNFYINDKPTGAVVGQQPFGGARASGTNDKAGGIYNLLRWVSPRSIKEALVSPSSWRYPFMEEP